MKKMLLLPAIFITFFCRAQQKELDSLLNELKKHSQEDTVRLTLLLSITHDYSYADPNKGISSGTQAVRLAKKLNDKKHEGAAYTYLAQNYQTLGNDSIALLYCLLSFNIKKQLKDSVGMALVYHTMAVSYYNRSDYYNALSHEQQALQISIIKNDSVRQAAYLNSIGVDYLLLGDYSKAMLYFQRAIYTWNKAGKVYETVDAFTNIGLIYSKMNNYNKALEYYNKALAMHESAGNFVGISDNYGNIGNLYDKMNDTLHSRIYYRKALELSQKSNYEYGMASGLGNLGISYSNTNEFDNAIPYLQAALKKFTLLNDNTHRAAMIDYLCADYIHAPDVILKKYNISSKNKLHIIEHLQLQSIALANTSHNIEELGNAYENLSEIYSAQKNYANALNAYKQSIIYKDSVLNDDKKQQITRIEMQYQFNKTQDSTKAVSDKQQAIARAEIQKQRIIKNSTMTGAGFLIIAGIGSFIFYKRNRDIKTKKEEAELKSQISDTEMKALRAQMNPHFIFNSLNSIADYIDKNQTRTASDFTTKFARLMRLVLENSEHKAIPLADDLKALELYMQLERFRLQNKFDYTITVDESIDKENTLVPPLILQPFVENSIWHGIAKKNGSGNIIIYIKQEGEMINCIVQDDGIGISESGIIDKENKSLGMRITKERIDIINRIKNSHASINISNIEKGVRAEVKLPLELSF